MVGARIGSYRVVGQIGAGGMGAVFEAVNEQIERRAAIKILHPQLSHQPEIAQRFLNEARAVNIIQHPGIVSIYEFGQLPDGTAYIVMEFLKGETLRARLKRVGRMGSCQDTLRLTRLIATALAAAHECGIVHRDLKPDNVMITPDPDVPGGERPKIFDFGIAKIAPSASADGQHVQTASGAMLGTPTYMSPEQCRGAELVTDRTDVYALGIMLYQMLIGEPPFVASGFGMVLAAHMFQAPRPIRDLDPSIPVGLADLVHAMLAKDPAQRPSMTQVAAAIHGMSLPEREAAGGSPRSIPGLTTQASIAGQAVQKTRTVHRKILLPMGAMGLAVASLAGWWSLRGKDTPKSQPYVAPPQVVKDPAPRVRWTLTSVPAGARVIRERDRQDLGQTPWRYEPAGESAPVHVVLQLAGFADRQVTLDPRSDQALSIELLALPREPARDAAKIRRRTTKKPDREILDDADIKPILLKPKK